MREFLGLDQEQHWAVRLIVYTRHWIHYGALFFVFVLALAAAAVGVFKR